MKRPADSPRTRTLTVDGEPFEWTREHRHRGRPERGEAAICVEFIRAWRAESEDAPLEIEFVDGSHGGITVAAGRHGAGRLELDGVEYDLDRPATMNHLIAVAFAEGWDPRARRSLIGADGFEWLVRHAAPEP